MSELLESYFEPLKCFNRGQYCSVDVVDDTTVSVSFHDAPKAVLVQALLRKFLTAIQDAKKSCRIKFSLCLGEEAMARYFFDVPFETIPSLEDICQDIITWKIDSLQIEFK